MSTRRRYGRCPACGTRDAACGGPGPDPSVHYQAGGEVTVMSGKLSVYEVVVNGYKTKMQLTEEEARRRGLIPSEPSASGQQEAETKTTRPKRRSSKGGEG